MKKMTLMCGVMALALCGCRVNHVCSEQAMEELRIDGLEPLGLFFFSLEHEGLMIISPPLMTTFGVSGTAGGIEGGAVFRSPDFDWKENQEELIMHIFLFDSAAAANASYSRNESLFIFQNGRFILVGSSHASDRYIETF